MIKHVTMLRLVLGYCCILTACSGQQDEANTSENPSRTTIEEKIDHQTPTDSAPADGIQPISTEPPSPDPVLDPENSPLETSPIVQDPPVITPEPLAVDDPPTPDVVEVETTPDNPLSKNRVSQVQLAGLSAITQYNVINKLLATLYKGVTPEEFFSNKARLDTLIAQNTDRFQHIVQALDTPLPNASENKNRIESFHQFSDNQRPVEYIQALLWEMPLSREYFHHWIAYVLVNTILFSPAAELVTANYQDAEKIYSRMVQQLDANKEISEIAYSHMISEENWHRFRSPEDNVREMLEIFLGRFEDAEVQIASQACQNWQLREESNQFKLVIDELENSAPQLLLGTTITNCYDFYQSIVDHPDFLQQVASIVLDYFLGTDNTQIRSQLANHINASDLTSFQSLFRTILLSNQYLLHTERLLWFEELHFNIAARIGWQPNQHFFKSLNITNFSTSFGTLPSMQQAAMYYKLGRSTVALDSLSFANEHLATRQNLLIDQLFDSENEFDSGWQAPCSQFENELTSLADCLSIAVVSRKLYPQEWEVLSPMFVNRSNTSIRLILFDYFSRLPELYIMEKTEADLK
jgi:hypothetical protein